MKHSTMIAAHFAALPTGTKLSNSDLKRLFPDTPRQLANTARLQTMAAGFIEYRGFKNKGESPNYWVTGSWTGSVDDYERLESVANTEEGQGNSTLPELPVSYKQIPKEGSPVTSGLYRFAPGDSFERVRNSLPKVFPVVEVRTRGTVNWDDGFETGFYLMESNGARKSEQIHIDITVSTNHASLTAMIAVIRSLKKPCIVLWQTTNSVVKVEGKNQLLCLDLIKAIEGADHIVFWQKSMVVGAEFNSQFLPDLAKKKQV